MSFNEHSINIPTIFGQEASPFKKCYLYRIISYHIVSYRIISYHIVLALLPQLAPMRPNNRTCLAMLRYAKVLVVLFAVFRAVLRLS